MFMKKEQTVTSLKHFVIKEVHVVARKEMVVTRKKKIAATSGQKISTKPKITITGTW